MFLNVSRQDFLIEQTLMMIAVIMMMLMTTATMVMAMMMMMTMMMMMMTMTMTMTMMMMMMMMMTMSLMPKEFILTLKSMNLLPLLQLIKQIRKQHIAVCRRKLSLPSSSSSSLSSSSSSSSCYFNVLQWHVKVVPLILLVNIYLYLNYQNKIIN